MSERREIHLWPCCGCMFWLFVLVAVIFCAGTPDLLDAIMYRVRNCPQPTVLLGDFDGKHQQELDDNVGQTWH